MLKEAVLPDGEGQRAFDVQIVPLLDGHEKPLGTSITFAEATLYTRAIRHQTLKGYSVSLISAAGARKNAHRPNVTSMMTMRSCFGCHESCKDTPPPGLASKPCARSNS